MGPLENPAPEFISPDVGIVTIDDLTGDPPTSGEILDTTYKRGGAEAEPCCPGHAVPSFLSPFGDQDVHVTQCDIAAARGRR
jgi:hypothetical protein